LRQKPEISLAKWSVITTVVHSIGKKTRQHGGVAAGSVGWDTTLQDTWRSVPRCFCCGKRNL